MDEILKIIVKCNKARKMFSIDDVKKICHIIIKNNNYKFVKHVVMGRKHPNDPNCGGTFCGDHIIFFYEGIMEILQKYSENFADNYQIDGSIVDVINYYYLTVIFHELAHARQHYLASSNHYSNEGEIVSFFFELGKDRDFYEKNYTNILTEVNAINVSQMTATYFYNKLPVNFVSPSDKNIYQSSLMSTLLYSNYSIDPHKEVAIGPAERIAEEFTKEMFENTNMNIDKYAKIVCDDKLTLYKKMMLGYPITYLEYAYAKLLMEVLAHGEEINVVKKLQKKL